MWIRAGQLALLFAVAAAAGEGETCSSGSGTEEGTCRKYWKCKSSEIGIAGPCDGSELTCCVSDTANRFSRCERRRPYGLCLMPNTAPEDAANTPGRCPGTDVTCYRPAREENTVLDAGTGTDDVPAIRSDNTVDASGKPTLQRTMAGIFKCVHPPPAAPRGRTLPQHARAAQRQGQVPQVGGQQAGHLHCRPRRRSPRGIGGFVFPAARAAAAVCLTDPAPARAAQATGSGPLATPSSALRTTCSTATTRRAARTRTG